MMCLLCQQTLKKRWSFGAMIGLSDLQDGLCQTCQEGFMPIGEVHCPSCYKPSSTGEVCQDCCYWKEQGKAVQHISLYAYNEGMKDFFSRFKFSGDYALREVFASDLRQVLGTYQRTHRFVPVPLSQASYHERGFNQVTALLEAANLTYEDIFEKKHTDKQSSKTREQRLATDQVFTMVKKLPADKPVLVIDDIYTTGATLQLLRDLLSQNGIEDVLTFSLAR